MEEKKNELITDIVTKFISLKENEQNFIAGYITGMEYAKKESKEPEKAAG